MSITKKKKNQKAFCKKKKVDPFKLLPYMLIITQAKHFNLAACKDWHFSRASDSS